jgi:predicted transcriptional regulator
MSNLEVGSDGSFLMIERSEKVYTEKGALSVPGGSLEYKEYEEKIIDDVKEGLKFAAVGELIDEILGEENRQRSLKVTIDSVMWDVNAQGLCGLNAYFGVTPKKTITRSEIYESFPDAKDSKESTGNFFFVNPHKNIDQPGENNLYATPRDVIELQKMQGSGTAALATQVYKTINQSYKAGKFLGLPPHPDSIANHFPNFNIFDVVKMCNVSIERLLAPGTIVDLSDLSLQKPDGKYGNIGSKGGAHEL